MISHMSGHREENSLVQKADRKAKHVEKEEEKDRSPYNT